MRELKGCRACAAANPEIVFSLGEQSLSGFLLPDQSPRYGPLDLVLCRQCGLVQLGHTYPGDWLYTWYGYRSGTNAMMVAALRELAAEVMIRAPLAPGDGVCDVGSNDGTFLRNFADAGIRKIGFDPAKNLGPIACEGLDLWVNDYFSAGALGPEVLQHGPMRAVTALAMFYQLHNPVEFLNDVRRVLHPEGLLAIQMNYLPSMLERNGYDNIVHEHQTYFSLTTLLPVLRAGGFEAIDASVNDINGGSFLIWCAPKGHHRKIDGDNLVRLIKYEAAMDLRAADTYVYFGRRLRQLRHELRGVIVQLVSEGKRVYVYGASTRGLTIMEYCQFNHALIAGAAERNPDKWGRAYGATGIPCVPEDEARAKADYFLVLPHHFLSSFVEREAEWLNDGGQFIVPLPRVRLIARGGVEVEALRVR